MRGERDELSLFLETITNSKIRFPVACWSSSYQNGRTTKENLIGLRIDRSRVIHSFVFESPIPSVCE